MQTPNQFVVPGFKAAVDNNEQDRIKSIIGYIISTHASGIGSVMLSYYNRVDGIASATPIVNAVAGLKANYPKKVHALVNNNFSREIVNNKVGYAGNEVNVSTNSNDDASKQFIADWGKLNAVVDANSESMWLSCACGTSYRLMYIAAPKTVKTINIPAYEMAEIVDPNDATATRYYLRYYKQQNVLSNLSGGTWATAIDLGTTYAELYDNEFVRFYKADASYNFEPYEAERLTLTGQAFKTNKIPHFFSEAPIIELPNNELREPEFKDSVTNIDAYDALMSSTTSEIQQLRLAYLFAKGSGLNINEDFVKTLEETGVFALPQDGEVGFIEKNISPEAVKFMLAEIRRNIYAFSNSIDMSESFADSRVITMKMKLLKMEQSAKITERKFTAGLLKQYRLLGEYWKGNGLANINYLDLEFTFTRNFPVDLDAEADTLLKLLQSVSRETAYAQVSFISDPATETAKWEEQKAKNVEDMSNLMGNSDIPNSANDRDTDNLNA